jgi:hypothetical protein
VGRDIIAGFTLAALSIPGTMGYTKIIGTPVITGLYTILIPMCLFAIFGSSRHLSVNADSATAAVVAAGLAGMAVRGSNEWLALCSLIALMAAVFMFLARVMRLGFPGRFSLAHGAHRLSHRRRRAGVAARGLRLAGSAQHRQPPAHRDPARRPLDRRNQSLCRRRVGGGAGDHSSVAGRSRRRFPAD